LVPSFDGVKSIEGSAFLGQDRIGGLGPHEGRGVGVVLGKVVMNGVFEFGDAAECSAPDALDGDRS
jgi:hypothetical protein